MLHEWSLFWSMRFRSRDKCFFFALNIFELTRGRWMRNQPKHYIPFNNTVSLLDFGFCWNYYSLHPNITCLNTTKLFQLLIFILLPKNNIFLFYLRMKIYIIQCVQLTCPWLNQLLINWYAGAWRLGQREWGKAATPRFYEIVSLMNQKVKYYFLLIK